MRSCPGLKPRVVDVVAMYGSSTELPVTEWDVSRGVYRHASEQAARTSGALESGVISRWFG
jgi:hypothetical protein